MCLKTIRISIDTCLANVFIFLFKFRDEEDRIVNELRSLRKSFSEDMLHQKCERRQFRARPVPIESRIPLYDKILEDQAMRFTHSTFAPCTLRIRLHIYFISFSLRERIAKESRVPQWLRYFQQQSKLLSVILDAVTSLKYYHSRDERFFYFLF